MTDEEIDRDLAAITSMEAAESEERRSRARQRAKQDRELLKELKRMRANGELTIPGLGD
jgi:hypothetical protein